MSEERDERPVTLPMWVVLNLVGDAYGSFTLVEAITSTHHLEAPAIIARAIDKARDE